MQLSDHLQIDRLSLFFEDFELTASLPDPFHFGVDLFDRFSVPYHAIVIIEFVIIRVVGKRLRIYAFGPFGDYDNQVVRFGETFMPMRGGR